MGSDGPIASSLTCAMGVNVANEIVAELDPGGELCVFTDASTDLLVDVVATCNLRCSRRRSRSSRRPIPAVERGSISPTTSLHRAFTLVDSGNMTFTDLEAGTHAATTA